MQWETLQTLTRLSKTSVAIRSTTFASVITTRPTTRGTSPLRHCDPQGRRGENMDYTALRDTVLKLKETHH